MNTYPTPALAGLAEHGVQEPRQVRRLMGNYQRGISQLTSLAVSYLALEADRLRWVAEV